MSCRTLWSHRMCGCPFSGPMLTLRMGGGRSRAPTHGMQPRSTSCALCTFLSPQGRQVAVRWRGIRGLRCSRTSNGCCSCSMCPSSASQLSVVVRSRCPDMCRVVPLLHCCCHAKYCRNCNTRMRNRVTHLRPPEVRGARLAKLCIPYPCQVYVEMAVEGTRWRTEHKPTSAPFWAEGFQFQVQNVDSLRLEIKVVQPTPHGYHKHKAWFEVGNNFPMNLPSDLEIRLKAFDGQVLFIPRKRHHKRRTRTCADGLCGGACRA